MSGFSKHDGGKAPLDLLPPRALEQTARAMGHGADKYGVWNWTKCDEPRRYAAAALRHIYAQTAFWCDNNDERGAGLAIDPESGLPHLAHAAASILIMLDLVLAGKGTAAGADPGGGCDTLQSATWARKTPVADPD